MQLDISMLKIVYCFISLYFPPTTEVYLEKYLAGLKVSNLFLDPLGNHLLISLVPKSTGFSPELLYLNRKTNKPKKIEKFKDHEVTAVAFNYENKLDSTTGSILIGTSRGLIFETEFGVDGDKVQNNWKQVSNGLVFYLFPFFVWESGYGLTHKL